MARNFSGPNALPHAFDFALYIDCTGNIEAARTLTRYVLDHLRAEADLEEWHIRVWFSGSKGFHVIVEQRLTYCRDGGAVQVAATIGRTVFKAELNVQEFILPFTAVRLYQPVYELQEMKALHVTVVPRGILITPLDRAKCEHEVQIDLAVQKKFSSGANDEIDPLMNLVQEIADFFKQRRLTNLPEAIWIETKNVPVYSPEHMQQLRQFTSVLTLSFRLAA